MFINPFLSFSFYFEISLKFPEIVRVVVVGFAKSAYKMFLAGESAENTQYKSNVSCTIGPYRPIHLAYNGYRCLCAPIFSKNLYTPQPAS